jgi:hypothetical protein
MSDDPLCLDKDVAREIGRYQGVDGPVVKPKHRVVELRDD